MKNRVSPLGLFCVLVASAVFCPTSSFAKDGFWKKKTPEQYALRFSKKIVATFPAYDFKQCQANLLMKPKEFVEKFDEHSIHLVTISNSELKKLKKEVNRVEHDKEDLLLYLDWLVQTSMELHSLKNYQGLFHFLVAVGMEIDLDAKSLSFDREVLPEYKDELDYLFHHFFRRADSEEFENKEMSEEKVFLANVASIRFQLEKLSGENFKMEPIQKFDLISSVCKRLSKPFVQDYVHRSSKI